MKMLKLLQELHSSSDLKQLPPAAKSTALQLAAMRSQRRVPRRVQYRINIKFDLRDTLTLPEPVSIKHVDTTVPTDR